MNFGLFVTDIIYEKYGATLTASGLQNQDWLDFWGTYLSVVRDLYYEMKSLYLQMLKESTFFDC